MGDAGYFRGTSAEQDNRFSDKEKKLMKQMRFADSLATKVDMTRVKLEVIKPWITTRISDLLGMEDDVLVEFVSNQLEADTFPDGRRIQINLTGFLNGKNARLFTGELWDLLVSAQEQTSGIPTAILESKKEEIKLRQEQTEKTLREVQKSVGKFQDKLISDIKKERASPPSDGRNVFPENSSPPNRSNRQPPSYSNYNSFKNSDRDRRPSDRQPEFKHHRPPNARRSKSRSRSPPAHHSKTNEVSRDRERDRERRDRDRDRVRGDLMDEIRQDRDKEKRRASPVQQQRPRRDFPPPPSYQKASRLESSDLKRALPNYDEERARESRSKRKSPSPQPPRKTAESSSNSSRSESEEENDEPKKKKKTTRSRSSEEDSKISGKPKKKKKSKKHKKHKKGKKAKREKERRTSEDEEGSEQSSQAEDEQPPSPQLTQPKRSREELEKSLRERALESMLKRTSKE